MAQNVLLILRILNKAAAHTGELGAVVHLSNLLLMGHQIVVELAGGAEVEASAVGKHIQLFAVVICPALQLLQLRYIPVQLTLIVKAIKVLCQILHALYGADLHIHRGAHLQLREVFLYKMGDHRRGGSDRAQVQLFLKIGNQISGLHQKVPGKAVSAVAVGIEQHIHSHALICQIAQLRQLDLQRLIGHQVAMGCRSASAAGHISPGKIHLMNVLFIAHNLVKKSTAFLQLVTDHVLH